MSNFIRKYARIFFFITLVFGACTPYLTQELPTASQPTDNPTSTPATSDLLNITWQLQSMDDVQIVAGSRITIRFENEAMEGNTGCRGFRGAYQVYGNSITFVTFNILGEEDACQDEDLRNQETIFTEYLKSCISYSLDDGQLEMYTALGEMLTFTAEPSED